jgi:hypothetical protein
VPVRIIFRGLILFDLPETGKNKGKLVAELINKPEIPRRPAEEGHDTPPKDKAREHKAPHGPHEHKHGGRIQIATDHGTNVLKPLDLDDKENLAISIPAAVDDRPVRTAPSFFDHVPRLPEVMANASIATVRAAADKALEPNGDLVRNTITVDSGILRVRNVVMWDHGAFPLSGNRGPHPAKPDERGVRAASHVPLKFVGSHWQGHMASEFVVDVWNANSVELKSTKSEKPTKAKAKSKVNHRVPYNTVEILITNYEVQEHTAVPWGLDFQWLFEAAGYAPADLAGDFGAFQAMGRTFDRDVFDNDRRLLLEPVADENDLDDYTFGRPFPYVALGAGMETLNKLERGNAPPVPKPPLTSNDEEDRPICIGGFK